MKKFKLIKTYPGSPELGTIIERECRHYCIDKNTHLRYPNIENYPEFWEEMIEKDYEIMSFILNSNGAILTKRSNGRYVYGDTSIVGKYTEEDILSNDRKRTDWEEDEEGFGYSVHSVKRLIDGEVFTVGDMCNPIGEYSYNKKPIAKIWFTDDGSLRIDSDNYTLSIGGIEHSKTPLFTTEDGVDIYDGDKYYYITSNFRMVILRTAKDHEALANGGKRFSTKERAERCVYNNKEQFSLNDIVDAMPLDNDDVTTTITKMFENLKNLK